MNDDMLRNIEYLREKADVSYEEAATLLERFDGNVMRVLVELERQGRVYSQAGAGETASPQQEPDPTPHAAANEAKEKATSFINKAFEHRLVVERENKEGGKETVANLNVPFFLGATVVAPHLMIASAALTFVCGYRVKLKREKADVVPDDVEDFVDKTVSNIKKTASSLSESMRNEKKDKDHHDDDDDEGGEITVE